MKGGGEQQKGNSRRVWARVWIFTKFYAGWSRRPSGQANEPELTDEKTNPKQIKAALSYENFYGDLEYKCESGARSS